MLSFSIFPIKVCTKWKPNRQNQFFPMSISSPTENADFDNSWFNWRCSRYKFTCFSSDVFPGLPSRCFVRKVKKCWSNLDKFPKFQKKIHEQMHFKIVALEEQNTAPLRCRLLWCLTIVHALVSSKKIMEEFWNWIFSWFYPKKSGRTFKIEVYEWNNYDHLWWPVQWHFNCTFEMMT